MAGRAGTGPDESFARPELPATLADWLDPQDSELFVTVRFCVPSGTCLSAVKRASMFSDPVNSGDWTRKSDMHFSFILVCQFRQNLR